MATPIYYFDTSKIGKDYTGKKDVLLLTNEQAVMESVKNILVTEPGERVMFPDYGCALSQYLFELIDSITIISIKSTITEAIRNYEKRIENLVVNVTETPDMNSLNIDVIFNMKTSSNTQTINLTLNKIR